MRKIGQICGYQRQSVEGWGNWIKVVKRYTFNYKISKY